MKWHSCDRIVRLTFASTIVTITCSTFVHSAYSDLVPCPPEKNIGDIWENDPNKRCSVRDIELQGLLLPKGSKVVFSQSKRLQAIKLPKPGILAGIKWSGAWIKISEDTGTIESGHLSEPQSFNGATISADSRVSLNEHGKVIGGKLAKPFIFSGFVIPSGVEVVFYPNGNLKVATLDKKNQIVNGPGVKFQPFGWLEFSEDGKSWNFREV